MITISSNINVIQRYLLRLQQKLGDLTPVMEEIGSTLTESTRLRFVDQIDPKGRPWKPLAQSTIENRRKGKRKGGSDQILRDTGRLMNSITYLAGKDRVVIGTNVVYGITHQFGAKKGSFGKTSKRKTPIPWGNIPARPFLGISRNDRAGIMSILNHYLSKP